MNSSPGNFSVDSILKAVNPDRAPSHARTYGYPPRVWYFIASFIALLSVYHFADALISRVASNHRPAVYSGASGHISLRQIPSAALNLVRTVIFRTTYSLGGSYKLNVAELFISCAYIVLLFTWAFINTTNLEGVKLSPQYYANRIGLIAATQLPLMISLGMKNNIITFLTGISFDKLNILHRIAARVICVMLWIHASGHVRNLQETWFRCGIMAISSLTLLCILSVQPLRSRAYEVFLVAHFIFALIFLCGSYYHADNNGLGYYLWPSLMVWGLDRFLRFIRIFFVNGGYQTLFNTKSSHPLDAKVEVITSQFLRVTLRRPDHFKWAPGQLAYLSMPSISATPWEAHPFTIASIDGDIINAVESESPSRDESCEKESEGSLESVVAIPTSGCGKKLVFLLRVHDGFTKRLLNAAGSLPAKETFGAYIDGPYCSPPSVRGFDTVIFFSGGSGISFTLPLLLDLIRDANMRTSSRRKVIFVWAIRHPEQIKAISEDLLRALDGVSDSLSIDMRIHVTGSMNDTEIDTEKREGSISSDPKNKLLGAPGIQFLSGRPHVKEIVKAEVAAASGLISINVCGTAGLAESVRSALRVASNTSRILKGGPSISLHVEAFGM
ncbi:ferric reductase NAD binding domain-containing protein [Mycena belliarum]|uniref:ferric-chelate reductase (NADPH) n=1 Tax=Mycena belliarum TaxID=1033014 RepID=A0AAD6UI75_9AGAR|nr:ferric reductase NAD binding domain-containing protein [Mycena belliae]